MIRLLIVEPDEEVLDCHVAYFNRFADLKAAAADDMDSFVKRLSMFDPHVMILEPVIPRGVEMLDRVLIPVIVLSRHSGDVALRSHPAIAEYYVKPKSVAEIRKAVLRLAGTV